VLRRQHRADDADQGSAVRKIPPNIGARRISLFDPSWGLLDQISKPDLLRNAVNPSNSSRASSR
jgi:hypothetical protein